MPLAVDRSTIERVHAVIAPYIRLTPIVEVNGADFGLQPFALTIKLEQMQHAGSFKTRGAFSNLLLRHPPQAGVVAASGGNHGAAVAYAAMRLGMPAHIFVPTVSSPAKIDRIRSYGAHLTVGGDLWEEALAAHGIDPRDYLRRRYLNAVLPWDHIGCGVTKEYLHLDDIELRMDSVRDLACGAEWAATSGALEVHAFDQMETIAGQGTLGRELSRQAPDLDTILVAVGGGGLIGGVAAWYGSSPARVVGVEPEGAPTLFDAIEAGRPVDAPAGSVAADSLAPRQVGQLMFPIAQAHVERVVLVTDDAIRKAQRALWEGLRVVAEPGGCAAFSALLSGAYQPASGERVGVVVSGANTTAVDFGI